MNSDEREIIEKRIRELRKRMTAEMHPGNEFTMRGLDRLEGNIGALEWVLREFPDERHITGCICADCAGAELTAQND